MKYSSMYSSPIRLEALLRRRKTSLEAWLRDSGISSWTGLVERCERMGVVPPDRSTFERIFPPGSVSDPAEGFIVIDPPALEGESTPEPVEPAVAEEPAPQKRKRRGSREQRQ